MTFEGVVSFIEGLLNDLDLRFERDVTVGWMTNRAPIGDAGAVPPRVRYRLMAMHTRLGGDWSKLEAKRSASLRFDFRVGETLMEVDRPQHFSTARSTTLDFYDELDHSLDIDQYTKLCAGLAESADRYRAGLQAADFPFPGGRTAQRAYFDAAKDLLAPANGFRLLRVPAVDGVSADDIAARLRVMAPEDPDAMDARGRER